MGQVLSVDLACKKRSDFGACLIKEHRGRVMAVRFLGADDLKLTDPPDPQQYAKAIFDFCLDHRVRIVLLDGPQAWKHPQNGVELSRVCERILNAPAKTGVFGEVKPKPYTSFVEFSTKLFASLVDLGAVLLSEASAAVPSKGGLLAIESFPLSAWRKLGIPSLPAKAKVRNGDIAARLTKLQELYDFQVEPKPSHDELQALVAGLAGVAMLAGNTGGYIAEGAPPARMNGALVEGFIVNPRRNQLMSVAKAAKKAKEATTPDAKTLRHMLYYLKLTREAEYRIERVLYRQGKIVGGVYVGRGQEAIAVGSAIQLIDGDVILPSHRDFAAWLIRGFTLHEIFLNWLGRANGPTRGRENTTHFGDIKQGLIPIISPLGDTCPVACGTALVQKQRGKGNVTLVHFGEGTTSRGDVHEAMNLAAVMKLPVIFICNNNAYAYSTPTRLQYAVKDLSVRGPAYGMPGVTIDGNDVTVVYRTAGEAIARARAGQGPSFIECKTFRMTGHSAHDAAEYIPKERFEEEAKKDPVARFEKLLLSRKIVTAKDLRAMEAGITKTIDEAVAFAESSPVPEGTEALEAVYCGDDCYWRREPASAGGGR